MRVFLFALVCSVLFASASSAGLPDPTHDSRIDTANRLLISQEYVKSAQLLRAALRENPRNLKAAYLLLAVKQTEILDYESYVIHGYAFCALADSLLYTLRSELPHQRGRDSLECLFFIAYTLGGKGVIQAKLGDWWPAIRNAYKSIALLNALQATDSSLVATYLATGVYKYYLSQNLKWLPFFGDHTQEGIREIRIATQSPFPFDIAAKNALCWIYIENGRYREADSICTTVLAQYPENTVFMRISASTAMWTRKWTQAAGRAKPLLKLSEGRSPVNWSDLLTAYWILASAYRGLHLSVECRAIAQKGLDLKVPGAYRRISYVQENLRNLAEIRAVYP